MLNFRLNNSKSKICDIMHFIDTMFMKFKVDHMSHLTLLDTQLQSFNYLQKSLTRISENFNNITENFEPIKSDKQNSDFLQGKLAKRVWGNFSVLINWTSLGYNCIIDKEVFSKTSNSNVDLLLENVTQNYAIEAIIGESATIGFEPLLYKQNLDGSKTIVLERISE